ncbi:MAG: endolytic transglycosylase MltG [Methylococcaceae bacterium]|nr:endolytic transglycosylase MltG [Methylococcaceae bacterium]
MSRLIGILILALSFAIGWLWMDYQQAVEHPSENREAVSFEIPKGASLRAISAELRDRQIIAKPHWFILLAYLDGSATKLKYGEYEISPGLSMRSMLALFVSGKLRQHSLTLVEGWRFTQVLAALAAQPALQHSLDGRSPAEVMAALGAPGEDPEGRFFPDTYFFTKGTPDVDVLKRAYRKMQTVLDAEWLGRAAGGPLRSPYEALILASIIEKETARPDERPQIAGVFSRRLSKGMLLQTDPTVIYGLGTEFDGDIRKDDLQRDTPYNTYVRPGLPPTPIAMPGSAALHAALHPAEGDALYFVARGDGYHQFSSSLDDHNRAVEHYQKSHVR